MTRTTFRMLPLAAICAAAFSAQATEANSDQRIEALEHQVKLLEAQKSSSLADKISFNGFASVNMQLANNKHGFAYSTDQIKFNEGSLVGLQSEFSINDSTSATVQLVARGTKRESWSPDIEWAFISHQFTPNFKMRGGKLRAPLFMYSDYLEVGYAQVGVRVPQEVYSTVVLTSITGADFIYDMELDDSTLSFQGFAGAQKLTANKHSYNAPTEFNDIYGGVVNWTDDTWTLRAVYGQAKVTSEVNWNTHKGQLLGTTFNDDAAKFYGLGGRYDNGSLMLSSELTRTEVEGFYADVDSAYVTAAYRINEVTPYITVSHMRTKDNDVRNNHLKQKLQEARQGKATLHDVNSAAIIQATQNIQRTTYSIGARWDVMTNVALKGDISYMTGFGETFGGLNSESKDKTNLLYTLKVDVVF
ncbi:porin [Vibrio nigripulchritudo]|uniref:porin n=1 Tax=Vibrio nigripulchritudo TaxID=28173 RepID=UPI0003B1E9DB|nr:porin [Vibrio nigripulchritudo]CCN71028.1 putative Porin [Vibrio nigripulchritudo SFn118]